MEAKTEKISGFEYRLTVSKNNKPLFQTRIYKDKGFFQVDAWRILAGFSGFYRMIDL